MKNSKPCVMFLSLALALAGCGESREGHAHGAEALEHAGHGEGHGDHGDRASAGTAHEGHVGHALPATAPVPDTSLFQLESSFSDENGAPFAISSLRGKPTLVVMFYGSCQTLCPVLVNDAKSIDTALSPEEREKLQVLLVTVDPERDTPERLVSLAGDFQLSRPRWKLLRGQSDSDVRELAMVLGVQYRKLDDGNYAHSALVTLLDPSGRIDMQLEGLQRPKEAMVARIRELVATVR